VTCLLKVKRRNDPTSAKVSTILGSYDKAKELVTSSHMIGVILQPATPRPASKHKFEAPSPLLAPSARGSSRKQAGAARNGLRPELSRQGVFEQFQQSVDDKTSDVTHDVTLGQSTDQLDIAVSASSSSQAECEKTLDCSRPSVHVVNGRHKSSSSSSSSSSASKRHRLKLSIPSPKVSMRYRTTRHV